MKQIRGLVTSTYREPALNSPVMSRISGEQILAKWEGRMETQRSLQRSWISYPVMPLGLIAVVATFILGHVGVVVARAVMFPDAGPREPATHIAGPQLVP